MGLFTTVLAVSLLLFRSSDDMCSSKCTAYPKERSIQQMIASSLCRPDIYFLGGVKLAPLHFTWNEDSQNGLSLVPKMKQHHLLCVLAQNSLCLHDQNARFNNARRPFMQNTRFTEQSKLFAQESGENQGIRASRVFGHF